MFMYECWFVTILHISCCAMHLIGSLNDFNCLTKCVFQKCEPICMKYLCILVPSYNMRKTTAFCLFYIIRKEMNLGLGSAITNLMHNYNFGKYIKCFSSPSKLIC